MRKHIVIFRLNFVFSYFSQWWFWFWVFISGSVVQSLEGLMHVDVERNEMPKFALRIC